jgi:hypothetical protein
VRVVFRKWGDRPHWEYDALRLGDDEHGTWLGAAAGTRLSRPGAAFTAPGHFVSLVPRDKPFVATFYDPGWAEVLETGVDVYVDITTVPRWDGARVRMVDLDLDVVRGWTGRVWVDDEDEFADHRVRWGYPGDVVRLAATSCDAVHAAVTAGLPPYDGVVGAGWLTRLAAACAS